MNLGDAASEMDPTCLDRVDPVHGLTSAQEDSVGVEAGELGAPHRTQPLVTTGHHLFCLRRSTRLPHFE